MSYTNETFVFSAQDEVSGTLKNVKIAAESAGVALSAFGKEIAENTRAEKELKALRKELKQVDSAAGTAAKSVETLNSKFTRETSFFANLTLAAKGFMAVVGKIGAVLAKPFREFARFDDVKTRLAPVLGSLDKAEKKVYLSKAEIRRHWREVQTHLREIAAPFSAAINATGGKIQAARLKKIGEKHGSFKIVSSGNTTNAAIKTRYPGGELSHVLNAARKTVRAFFSKQADAIIRKELKKMR